MDNRYAPYSNSPPQRHEQSYGGQYRDDFGGNNRRSGGAVRDSRGRRGGGNERYNDHKPYNRKPGRRGGGGGGGGGFRQSEPSESDPAAKEKPCRTLFVRNIQYNTSENAVKDMFVKYGEVKDVFNLIQNRGMIFVTFYDVRAAEDAKNSLQNAFLNDRKIDIHYSLPKEEEEKAKCDRTKNQGTLLYTLKNGGSELDDDELQRYFSRFGEVKAIRVPHFKKSTAYQYNPSERNQQRLVEFYDSRACVAAFDATYDTEYLGGKWDVVFFWDYPFKDRHNTHQRRERHNEREDERINRRRFDDRYVPPPPTQHQYNSDPRLQDQPSHSDTQRLEQAQKAQQILSMLSQQPPPPSSMSNYQAPPPSQYQPMKQEYQPLKQEYQPVKQEYQPVKAESMSSSSYPPAESSPYQQHQQQQPLSFVNQQQPEGQPAQVQHLLSLLSQATQQQNTAPPVPHMQQSAAPIPGMDPATALTQLAALLQQQQQQQNQ